MSPGSERTFIVTLESRAGAVDGGRVLATLRDWSITSSGEVEFFDASSTVGSAAPWIIYTPTEAVMKPGKPHSIRVTVSVPASAQPGDHLAALVVEPRASSLKEKGNTRHMTVRYLMASMIYIKVPALKRSGSLAGLTATSQEGKVVIKPTFRNAGNTVLRPNSSLQVADAKGQIVVESKSEEMLPVLAGAELSAPQTIDKPLSPGTYSVKYRVDFHDGNDRIQEGVTNLVIPPARAKAR